MTFEDSIDNPGSWAIMKKYNTDLFEGFIPKYVCDEVVGDLSDEQYSKLITFVKFGDPKFQKCSRGTKLQKMSDARFSRGAVRKALEKLNQWKLERGSEYMKVFQHAE